MTALSVGIVTSSSTSRNEGTLALTIIHGFVTSMLSEARACSTPLPDDDRLQGPKIDTRDVCSFLKAIMIEIIHGEHAASVHKILRSDDNDNNRVLLCLCLIVNLSSNNHISKELTYQVFIWATSTVDGSQKFLRAMFGSNTLAAQAFIENIFHYVVSKDNLEVVKLLLECGLSPNTRLCPYQTSPLQLVASQRSLPLLRLLLDAGADPDGFTRGSKSKISPIAGPGRQMITKPLDSESAPQVKLETGRTKSPIEIAIEKDDLEMVSWLINAGANVNAATTEKTPLQAAVEKDNVEIVKDLLQAGANVNAPPASSAGRTALQAAAERGYSDIVGVLLDRKADINSPPVLFDGKTVLQAAVGSGSFELIWQLLESKNVISILNCTSLETALRAATSRGYVGVAYELLNVAITSQIHISVGCWQVSLIAAAQNGRIDIVQLLCDFGTKIYDRSTELLSEVLEAVEESDYYIVNQFIKEHII